MKEKNKTHLKPLSKERMNAAYEKCLNNMKQFKQIDNYTELIIGDRIRDLEDGDCYYEGVVTSIDNKSFKYKPDLIIWGGDSLSLKNKFGNGDEIEPQFWILEKLQ